MSLFELIIALVAVYIAAGVGTLVGLVAVATVHKLHLEWFKGWIVGYILTIILWPRVIHKILTSKP